MRAALVMLAVPPLLAVYLMVVLLTLDLSNLYAQYLLVVPLAYALGSIPWGYMIIQTVRGVDIRRYGSGRIGTTNVLRIGGGRLALLVLLLDASKGILAVLLARAAGDSPTIEVVAGLVALAGHNWPAFLGFKGGRGIAPGAGALAIISPITLAVGVGLFAGVALASRYISLASLLAVVAAVTVLAILTLVRDSPTVYLAYVSAGGGVIIWQHRDNIQRLVQGRERRLGEAADKLAGREPGR